MKTVFVYRGLGHSTGDEGQPGHPSHRGFQDQIGAIEYVHDRDGTPLDVTFLGDVLYAYRADFPHADIYILENTNALYSEPFIRRVAPESTIIFLAAHGVFGLDSYNFAGDNILKGIARRGERFINHKIVLGLCDRVDGILSISEYVGDYLRSHTSSPIESVYPYIQPSMFDALNSLPLDTTQSNRVVTVCESRDHKGVDLLVEAWPDVRSVYPEAELHVIGQGHPETYADTDGVRVRGFVQDLVEEYAHAEVYVHPARRDAFGVSVVEAMLGGAIPIVTETTGAREVVQAVDPNLISEPSVTDLTDTLIEVMGAKTSQKRAWRSESRQQATAYTADNKRAEFERRFKTLLSRIGSSPLSVDGNN